MRQLGYTPKSYDNQRGGCAQETRDTYELPDDTDHGQRRPQQESLRLQESSDRAAYGTADHIRISDLGVSDPRVTGIRARSQQSLVSYEQLGRMPQGPDETACAVGFPGGPVGGSRRHDFHAVVLGTSRGSAEAVVERRRAGVHPDSLETAEEAGDYSYRYKLEGTYVRVTDLTGPGAGHGLLTQP